MKVTYKLGARKAAPTTTAPPKEKHLVVPIERVLTHYGLRDQCEAYTVELQGFSPFNDTNEPTLSVNLRKNIWNDFAGRPTVHGQQVRGTSIGLIQALEGCSVEEAKAIGKEIAGYAQHG